MMFPCRQSRSVSVLVLTFLTLTTIAQATDPIVVWSVDGSNILEYSTHDGTSWSAAASGPNIGGEARFLSVKKCPQRDEVAVGSYDLSNDVNLVFWDGSSFGSVTELSTNATDDWRPFDIAYENSSGDMIIVYGDSGEGNLGYRTYDGTTLSSETDITLPSGTPVWVYLIPRPGSDEMMLILTDSGDECHAKYWDGSSWGSWTQISSDIGAHEKRNLHFAFEASSGDGVIVFRDGNDLDYRTWDGTTWSSASSTSLGVKPVQVHLRPNPSSNEILLGVKDEGYDINLNRWDGSAWDGFTEIETDTINHTSTISFGLAYEPASNEALVIYSQDGSDSVRYRTWNGTSWSSESTSTNVGSDKYNVQLATGVNSGEIFVAIRDSSEDLNLLVWDGSSLSATNEIETSLVNSSQDGNVNAMIAAGGSQVFTDVSSSAGFNVQTTTYYHRGSGFSWGDMDNDGDLDVIITGDQSKLLIQDASDNTFTASSFGGGGRDRQGALADLDNDGDLDYFHGEEKYYENDGSASFSDEGNAGYNSPSNPEGLVAADVNHDGWCDIMMFANYNWIGHHQGSGTVDFSETNSSSYGLNDSGDYGNGDFASSCDVNEDGYVDFFWNYGTGKLFLSNGDGTYTENASGISSVTGNDDKMGSCWGDYDNDGDMDLFVPRFDGGNTGYLWRNDGGTFTDQTSAAGISDTSGQRSCTWGDYDNDGDLDLYIGCHSGADNVLYSNDGDGTFTQVTGEGQEAAGDVHDVCFVDYDNDGDLDISVVNEDSQNILLRNSTNSDDYLKVRLIGAGAGATNVACLGVRVELYDAAGSTFIARREVGMARGFSGQEPLWLHFGGVTDSTTYTIKVYFEGKAVTDPYTTTVVPNAVSTTIGSTTINQMITITEPAPLFTDVSSARSFDVTTSTNSDGSGLHWGDLNDDGFVDAVITGNSTSRVLISAAGATFSSSTLGSGSQERQGAFADFENDGDLDFYFYRDYYYETHFENNGSGTLTDQGELGATDPHNNEGLVAADVDHDGFCDVVFFSDNGNWICHHQGTDPATLVATKDSSYGLNDGGDVGNGDFASSADVNEDGYVDFFYHYGTGKLFLSDGDGTYTENASGISVVTGNSDKMGSAWADYDNDGDLDLYVCRYDSGSTGYLWQNSGGTFTDVTTAAGITDISGQRSCTWGDYDNDGDLDLYIATRSGAANVLYQNDGDATFTKVNEGTAISGDGNDACFVDYDNDGDLDLTMTRVSDTNVLLENGTDNEDYLKVRLIGGGAGKTNLACTGVRIELFDAAGTTFIARRDIGGARGHGGGEPLWAHFGGLTKTTTYTLKVYFEGSSVSSPQTQTVVPASVSTTIGASTIPQMITITETSGITVDDWQEVPR